MADDKKQQRAAVNRIVRDALHGNAVTASFFKRYAIYIVGVIAMVLCYIGNKYIYQSRQEEIIRLKRDLNDARTDLVDASARYNSMVRESHMMAYVDTFNLTLTAPDQPPFIIK